MKQYPISEGELRLISERRNIGTALFSTGTALIGLGLGLLKDTVFTDSPKTVALPLLAQAPIKPVFDWTPVSIALIIFGVLSFLGGIYFTFTGKSTINKIMDETKFDEQGSANF